MGGALAVITQIGSIAAQANVTAATIFTMVRAIRDMWPRGANEDPISDDVLITEMERIFKENGVENLDWQAQIQALIDAENSADPGSGD